MSAVSPKFTPRCFVVMKSYGKQAKIASKSQINKYFSNLRKFLFARYGRLIPKYQYKLAYRTVIPFEFLITETCC